MDLETIKTLHRLNQLALIVIDAQKNFASTKIGTVVSAGIIEAKNTLSTLGILTYLIFMDHQNIGHQHACGGLIKGLLQTTDPNPIPKQSSNALLDTKLQKTLDYYGIKGVLITGNNADACILTSMRSMGKHFQIAGVSTAIGSSYQNRSSISRTFNLMENEGYGIHTLEEITTALSSDIFNPPTSP